MFRGVCVNLVGPRRYEAWCNSVESAREGLQVRSHIASARLVHACACWIDVTRLTVQATLVVRHVQSGRLFVNFDAGVVQVRPRVCAWLVVL